MSHHGGLPAAVGRARARATVRGRLPLYLPCDQVVDGSAPDAGGRAADADPRPDPCGAKTATHYPGPKLSGKEFRRARGLYGTARGGVVPEAFQPK